MRWGLILAMVISGCAANTGTGTGREALPEASELLAALRERASQRQNMRALGRVEAFTPEGRVRLRAVFVAERPRSFRVETLTPFEQPVDVLVSDGERLYLLREGRLYEGAAVPENVARVLPLPLRPEEIVETLLGGVPVPRRFEAVDVVAKDQGWQLELRSSMGERGQLLIDPETRRVLEARLVDAAGAPQTSVRFDRFVSAADGGPAHPTEVRVEVPSRETKVRIRLKDAETDVELPGGLFTLRTEDGSPPEPL